MTMDPYLLTWLRRKVGYDITVAELDGIAARLGYPSGAAYAEQVYRTTPDGRWDAFWRWCDAALIRLGVWRVKR
jgi:hypothetical protein